MLKKRLYCRGVLIYNIKNDFHVAVMETGNGKKGDYMDSNNGMIDEVLKHLDSELALGAMRMSVVFDEKARDEKSVSHKCCQSYGRPATETVGLLDMYTDISAGAPDRG